MNNTNTSTESALLEVELPRSLIESSSVSTFLPEEEASIYPLLSSNTNGDFSHPLTPGIDNDCNNDINLNTDNSTTLFNKHGVYQHLQAENGVKEDLQDNTSNMNMAYSKDAPSFVSWNWPFIRKITFFVFMSSLFAMCAVVVAMIVTLPKTCNPKSAWYAGSVIYEIFPASFQDSNNDGVGDIRGIEKRVEYLSMLGVSTIRLNSIFESPNYPEDFENLTSLTKVAEVLGLDTDIFQLSQTLHAHNMSLLLDLPLTPFIKYLQENGKEYLPSQNNLILTNNGSVTNGQNFITDAIEKWIGYGVDGFYIKDVESYLEKFNIVYHLTAWKKLLGPNRILIVSESLIENLDDNERAQALAQVTLVDVFLNIHSGVKSLEERIRKVLASALSPTESGVWICWSINGVDKRPFTLNDSKSNTILAATIMQLMLPGTPNIFYGDEVNLRNFSSSHHENLPHMRWKNSLTHFKTSTNLPKTTLYNDDSFKLISQLIELRGRSPSIYKNSICKINSNLPNTQIRRSRSDILILERIYPRRNSFVSISNFGNKQVTMDMTSMYYSGELMLQDEPKDKVFFKNFQIGSLETIIVKLDK